MGYLILSHVPQVKDELVTSVDVWCAAIRGMGQGMALGLDDTVHAVTQPGFDWSIEMESVERLAAVSHLYRKARVRTTMGAALCSLTFVFPEITALTEQLYVMTHRVAW